MLYGNNWGLQEFSNSLNVMVNYHYHVENRVLTWKFPSMIVGYQMYSLHVIWVDVPNQVLDLNPAFFLQSFFRGRPPGDKEEHIKSGSKGAI